jgi:hypothetical protein
MKIKKFDENKSATGKWTMNCPIKEAEEFFRSFEHFGHWMEGESLFLPIKSNVKTLKYIFINN